MSSLLERYAQLTDVTNQGVFDNEEWLLAMGRVFQASVLRSVFPIAAEIDFVIQAGSFPVGINAVQFYSNSVEFQIDFYYNPTFTGGTEIPLVNQNAGSANTPEVVITINPVITDEGTLGNSFLARGETGGIFTPAITAENSDLTKKLIQPGVPFLVRVTNSTAFGADELDSYIRLGEFAYNQEDDQMERVTPAFKASPNT